MVRRYVLVKVLSDSQISSEQFNEVMTHSVKKFFGEIGYVKVNPRLIRFDATRSEAIVACERDRVAELQTALALTGDISGLSIAPVTLRVSGTIKSLRQRAGQHS